MKSSFDLDLNIEKKEEVTPSYTINTLNKLCTITAVSCFPTGKLAACQGTYNCNTKSDCIV